MSRHTRYNRTPKGRARNQRYEQKKIRMRVGGVQLVVGVAPTTEAAQQLRQKIREGAPRAAVRNS